MLVQLAEQLFWQVPWQEPEQPLQEPEQLPEQMCIRDRIKVGVKKIFGTVEHCIVACRLDFIQKSLADIGVDLLAASSVDALVLDIKGNRVAELVRFDCLDDLFGCPSACLCCGGCLLYTSRCV